MCNFNFPVIKTITFTWKLSSTKGYAASLVTWVGAMIQAFSLAYGSPSQL